jgi:hypothetical protein
MVRHDGFDQALVLLNAKKATAQEPLHLPLGNSQWISG